MTTIIIQLHSNITVELQDENYNAAAVFQELTSKAIDENGVLIQPSQHILIAGQIFSKIDIKNVMTKETYDASATK